MDMLQEVLVFILFVGAIGFVGNIFRKSMHSGTKSHGSCSACDANAVGKIHAKQLNKPSKG